VGERVRFRKELRLVVANPEDLGQRVRRAQAVAGDAVHVGRADALSEAAGLLDGALIRPDDGRAQRRAVRLERHDALHLPAESDAGHFVGAGGGARQQLTGGAAHSAPPVVRVLLGPTGVGVLCLVGVKGAADQLPVAVVERRFVAVVPKSWARM
jgi:hypothetical protein